MNYLRYTGLVVVWTIGLSIITTLIDAFTGVDLHSAFVNFVPTIVAAGHEGKKFAARHGRMPTSEESGRFMIIATFIVTALSLATLAVVAAFIPPLLDLVRQAFVSPLLIVTLVILLVATALLNLIFMRSTARQWLKRNSPVEVFK